MAGIQPFSAEAEYPEKEAKVKSNKIYFWERFEAEEGSKDVLWPQRKASEENCASHEPLQWQFPATTWWCARAAAWYGFIPTQLRRVYGSRTSVDFSQKN